MSIEDIILDHDQRGMVPLRPYLPADFCHQAAQYIGDHPGDLIIVTGFYILRAGSQETDGPPGAIAIGNALQAMGRRVAYLSDIHTTPALRDWLGDSAEVVDFPIADAGTSRQFAATMLERIKPALLISIERCGRTRDDNYLNMRSADITPYTARLDYLFEHGIPSVGIGDGGNEIGMGNLAEIIPRVGAQYAVPLPKNPAVTRVDKLIIASVSNWGGYGLVAALSRIAGRNLLPTVEHETRLIRRMVDAGAVDGTTGDRKYCVDNFTAEQNGELLSRLHWLLAEEGIK